VPAQQVDEAGGAGRLEGQAGDGIDGHGLEPRTPGAACGTPTERLRVTCMT
jgi:hypothetical protein